jgi:hypothetical protein
MLESLEGAERSLSAKRRERSRYRVLTPLGKATLLWIIVVCSDLIALIACHCRGNRITVRAN